MNKRTAIPVLTMVIAAHAFCGSAVEDDSTRDPLVCFLNASFQIKRGMPEGEARTILKNHGFPVPVPEGSNQVTSVSVGTSFHWTSHFRLTESGRFSLHLDCSTTMAGLHGVVERVRIVCADGRTIELSDYRVSAAVKTEEHPQHKPAPYPEPRKSAVQQR
jgi:hypothetical protein